jgi:hypothetical protein
MAYFKNVKSFEDLKEQFKKLAKANHPDAGGNAETMKEINCEYDALFPVWKSRYNATVTADQQTSETAQSTRSKFYTDFGWEGHNHDWNRSLKEIAVIVRAYVKEKYPTFKFSVRTSYASMCQELHVSLKEAPFEIYKTIDQLTEDDIDEIIRKANRNQEWTLTSWYPEEAKAEIQRIWSKGGTFFKVYREDVAEMLKDVDSFVNSYNYEDCDGMTDYFHVDFYYFDCKPDYEFKIVSKTARVKDNKTTTPVQQPEASEPIQSEEYDITESMHTKTGAKIWLVKIKRTLSRDEYLKEADKMKAMKAYYSTFTHSFVFGYDPSELLNYNATPAQNNTEETSANVKAEEYDNQTQNKAKKSLLIDKINKQIESTQKKIDSLSGNYQTNTWKRMNEQASRDLKVESYHKDINILQYLIDTLDNRDLTPLEENLIISSFRDEIHSYYVRNEAYNSSNRGTAIEFPRINYNSPLDGWWNKEIPTRQKRLQKAGINNTAELLKAVNEYKQIYNISNKPVNYTEKKIKQLEREYKMQQKGDINFTPSKVVEQLIQYAHIDSNSRVLEPSAGIGNIADQIKKYTNNLDVCEQMFHFGELLKLKGHNVVGNDFLEFETNNKYDAIIMNPPFSDEQNHIRHAYELLNDGGTLVSISSPHWTFANDRKSIEFREWLDCETCFTEDLQSGTFEMTGVASKIIVIEKHAQQEVKTA